MKQHYKTIGFMFTGVPALIVGVSAAVNHEGYGTPYQ